MDILSPDYTVPSAMVPVKPARVERTTTDELLAAARELVERLEVLDTARALPGDEAVEWLEHLAECEAIVEGLGSGLLLVGRPE